MNILAKLRNNWKKSVLAFSALGYGTHYLIDRKYNGDLMQAYCYEVIKYSREKIKQPEAMIKRVTIFLNPIANGERGNFIYNKNVAPLLNLSGLDIRIVRLEKNSEANAYMKELDVKDTDCIVVAGGNATLNEVLSGLANRPDAKEFLKRIPIGIIPLGETNSFMKKWFENFSKENATRSSNEKELRLFADSALAIIKGVTQPAHLVKITLNQSNKTNSVNDNDDESLKMKKVGAYSLLKQNQIYGLSSVSCGFMTVTDANKDNYWYLGFKRFKEHMNRYFMARYLRRDPLHFRLAYKCKCTGCSKCLNQEQLKNQLDDLIKNGLNNDDKTITDTNQNKSFLKTFYKKFFNIKPILNKEALNEIKLKTQLEKEKLLKLIENSKITNENCNKIFSKELKQVQIISNINEPYNDPTDEINASIATVIVKDPEFNQKDMFLANKKHLTQFEIKKLHTPNCRDKLHSTQNYFAIEIDGEIYKLNNKEDNNLTISVELVENCINLIKFDQELSNSIKVNPLTKIFSLSQRTLTEYFFGSSSKKKNAYEMPPILPFEKLYLNYWKPQTGNN